MTAPTQPAIEERRASGGSRPWCRLHRSTCLAMLLVTLAWTIVLVAGERVIVPYRVPTRVEHGWPLRFLTRESPLVNPPAFFTGEKRQPRLDLWGWDHVVEFDAAALASDVAIALLALGTLMILFERRRRRVRRLWQLSLRDLAIVTLAVATLCGWWASIYRQTRRQEETLRQLDRVLASALMGDGLTNTIHHSHYDARWQAKGDWLLELVWDEVDKPRWFAEVVGLNLVVEEDAAEDALGLVGRLPSLKEFSISVHGGSKRLSDESVQRIAALRQLEYLEIGRLGGNWDVSMVGVSSDQAAYLKPLADLRHLSLSGNYITDEGLLHLRDLKRLELLEISNNPITDAGVDALREALPDLTVWDD